MPWVFEPMKGVLSYEKPREGAMSRYNSGVPEWGNPTGRKFPVTAS